MLDMQLCREWGVRDMVRRSKEGPLVRRAIEYEVDHRFVVYRGNSGDEHLNSRIRSKAHMHDLIR